MKLLAAVVAILLCFSLSSADSSWVRQDNCIWEFHDITKWTHDVLDFPTAASEVAWLLKEKPKDTVSIEEFAETVQNTIAKGRWDPKRGWNIQGQNGLLVVRAPRSVQKAIRDYLKQLAQRRQ